MVWFGTLDYRTLVRPDEGRYAEIPREMLASGDWLTPRLNGIKYFEKPPLQYWVTAVAYKAFGEHEWTARLWPALTGFLSVLLAAWAGRRLWGEREGNLAALILASGILYIGMSRIITLDMGLSFFLQLAWTAFLFAQQAAPSRWRRWAWLMWAALAFAALSKGIVALLLPAAALVIYTVLNRDISPWKRLAPFSGLAIFLAIAAPWFITVSLANPEFPYFFFVHEHFERFLTKVHHRYKPDWYFVPVYLIGALPWTFVLTQALARSWRRDGPAAFQPQRFLMIWSVFTFVFFSLSDSKLPPYILPIFPALALLGGRFIAAIDRRSLLRHIGALCLLMPILFVIGLYGEQHFDRASTADMVRHFSIQFLIVGVGSTGAFLSALWLAYRGRLDAALIGVALGGMVATHGALLAHESLVLSNSAAYIASMARPLLTPGVPFYSVQRYEQTLPFYLKRAVTIVEAPDELAFGLEQEPQKWIPTREEFKQRWVHDVDAFAIMPISTFDALRGENFPMMEVARDRRSVIVRKPALP